MSLTKNKNLRAFKQKTESSYQMNQGIPKIRPYLERQMYDFRFMGMTLNGWNTFSNQMTLLCFLAGGAAAFGAYWYRTDPYYIVLYGSMGILAGLFTIPVSYTHLRHSHNGDLPDGLPAYNRWSYREVISGRRRLLHRQNEPGSPHSLHTGLCADCKWRKKNFRTSGRHGFE